MSTPACLGVHRVLAYPLPDLDLADLDLADLGVHRVPAYPLPDLDLA